MATERRYNLRHPLEIKIYIRYRDKRIFTAQARNVSINGMLLTTSSLILPAGHAVTLEFKHKDVAWSLPANVIHCGKNLLGVQFESAQPELFELGALLNTGQQMPGDLGLHA
jgi:hypothetical protein